MINFHDHKLWQDAFVVLMDIHDVAESAGKNDIMTTLISDAQLVAAKIADGLSRNDHRIAKELIGDGVGLVAIARTQLAVSWGRGLVNDETFKAIDDKYAKLTDNLQSFR
jgi:hypothetical protein